MRVELTLVQGSREVLNHSWEKAVFDRENGTPGFFTSPGANITTTKGNFVTFSGVGLGSSMRPPPP